MGLTRSDVGAPSRRSGHALVAGIGQSATAAAVAGGTGVSLFGLGLVPGELAAHV